MNRSVALLIPGLVISVMLFSFASFHTAKRLGLQRARAFPEPLTYLDTRLKVLPPGIRFFWQVSFDADIMANSPFVVYVSLLGSIVESGDSNDLSEILKELEKR